MHLERHPVDVMGKGLFQPRLQILMSEMFTVAKVVALLTQNHAGHV